MTTRLHLHPSFLIAPVDERIFGGFLEHLGRAVYGGVYEPGSPNADADGFRTDVMAALKRLRFTAMRYPGGNFVSGYDWWDGVGPRAERPTKLDLAWQSLESNRFGTNEFMDLARKMGWTPMFAANLGTGTPVEARNWVEYCNGRAGSYWADLRIEHGYPEPHNVKLWCLGNEMDGSWQIGHVPAREYAIRAQQTARLMKMYDPTLETVVCGSCGTGLPTYLEWDREVLDYCHDDVDYVSLHRYVGNHAGNSEDYLAVGPSIDQQIEEMDSMCRFVAARKRSKRRVFLSFDEWNVWYRSNHGEHVDGRAKHAPPLLEEVYNLEDALVVGQFLNSFINHADSVKIANLAQIVNVIAPMLTMGDRLLIQSIFYPIEMVSKRREGTAMRCAAEGPTVHSESHGEVAQVDASAILHNAISLSVFLVNRSTTEPAEVALDVAGAAGLRLASGEIITGRAPADANSLAEPDRVASADFGEAHPVSGGALLKLPPLSMFAGTFDLG